MNVLKQRLIDDFERSIGRHDAPHIFGEPPGDPGLVGPGSVSWEIHSDVATMAVGGVASVIMEILHPSVMAGVGDMSSYREDPFRRARTTFGYVLTTTFGNTVAATRLINAVKAMHAKVNGARPDGVPYRALDPELLGWVHTCIPWGVICAYERLCRPLSVAEKDSYLREQAVIGRMSGAEDIPTTAADLEAYVEAMRPNLEVNHQTMEFFEFLETSPLGTALPGPLRRPSKRLQVMGGMSVMPKWARDLTGYETPAPLRRTVRDPSLQAYARAMRWAYGTPPWRALAEARMAAAGDERLAA